MSAVRASVSALGSQKSHALWGEREHQGGVGTFEPPSTHSPEGVCTMSCVVAEYANCCAGSVELQLFVLMIMPGPNWELRGGAGTASGG